MDCEKFDNVMLDELYGELDEVTSAAAKRHLSGCARCSAAFAGLKATRRVATLPLVDPPDDLMARVLSKSWEAQKVVPIKSRAARFVSVAGSWAMRPQTAMAAVFLLMIGSSVLFLSNSGRKVETATQQASNAFSGGGSPAPIAKESDRRERLDYASAASAHGTEPLRVMPQATATAAPTLALDPNAAGEDKQAAPGQGQALAFSDDNSPTSNAGPIGGAAGGGGGSGGYYNNPAPKPMVQSQAAPTSASRSGDAELEKGVNQYKDKKYYEAQKTLDGISGSPDAALWAARSIRDSKGCSAAMSRYDDLMTRSWGTNAGYEATWDEAQCYEKMNNRPMAIARYSKLLSIPPWAVKAQEALDRLQPASAKKPAAAPRMMEDKANSY